MHHSKSITGDAKTLETPERSIASARSGRTRELSKQSVYGSSAFVPRRDQLLHIRGLEESEVLNQVDDRFDFV
jgi:hypothetical protein